MKKTLGVLLALATLVACNKNEEPIIVTTDELHMAIDKVTEIMVHDIFSPPVAARIYAYPNIAAYEIMAQRDSSLRSLAGQIDHLGTIPTSNNPKVNYPLAALIAHMEVSKALVFSEERMEVYRDSLYAAWKNQNSSELEASKEYGLAVADFIKNWMDKDNYK